MKQFFKVFRITRKHFYDLAEWGIAAQPDPRDPMEMIEAVDFDTYDEAGEWIRNYAPVTTRDQYYIIMPVFQKLEESTNRF